MGYNMHMFLHNDPKFKERRRDLRNNQTKEEQFLWMNLRNKKLGVKFLRQHSIGPYILDFYCPSKKIGIELDGHQHLDDKEYDKNRDEYLELNGIKILRFWNSELSVNIDGVLDKIMRELTSPPLM